MKVLSLCDGMSCGHIALDVAGIKVEQYFAAEIKDIGIKATKDNYPDTIHIGDVNKIKFNDGILYTEKGCFEVGSIDLVMFGSPCQTFSIAIPSEQRIGLNNLAKSGLFYECNRILKEVNPTYFLMENVRSMSDEDRDAISSFIGTEPIMIDSQLVCPALRKRYYWTNIPNITQPQNKNILLQDVLEYGYTDRKKARCLAVIDSRPNTTPIKMFHRYYSTGFTTLIFKSEQHYKECVEEYKRLSGGKRKISAHDLDNYEGHVFDGVRYMNQTELERCQTVPEGYTKCLNRNEAADVLGDGWTVDVIAHIFTNIPKEEREDERKMELKLKSITFPEVIEFNYEELKQEITERVASYKNLVYTDDQIQDAKKDVAMLRKFTKALSDERIRVKKDLLKPYEDFESKVKELTAIVDESIKNIDGQIKAVEDEKKGLKLDEIMDNYSNIGFPDWVTFDKLFDEKWLNASVSLASVQKELESKKVQIETDLQTLQNLPDFSFEAIEVYKTSLDINQAIQEGKRLSEIQKRKAEQEAIPQAPSEPQPEVPETPKAPDTPKNWVSFKAYISVDDALALRKFFESRNIEFEAI